MKYTVVLPQKQVLAFGLSVADAVLFSYMYDEYGKDWMERDGDGYCWLSKSKVVSELPMLTDKPDTVYRYWKRLEKAGLIKTKTDGKKSFYKLTAKAKKWTFEPESTSEDYPTSDKSPTSDNDPSDLGKLSDLTSEDYPTNKTTIDKYNQDKREREGKSQTGPEKWEARGNARMGASNLYDKFLDSYLISPTNKSTSREEWFRDRGGWSCESIGAQIIAALQNQHANCDRFSQARFVPKPEDYLRHERWADKIVAKIKPVKKANGTRDRSVALSLVSSQYQSIIDEELSS